MKHAYYFYTLDLRAPAVFPSGEGDPNRVSTLPYVPGSVLRGAVASNLGGDPGKLQELVLNERVRYLNAYPVYGDSRALPTPLSLRKPKGTDDAGAPRNFAAFDASNTPEGQWMAMSAPFITFDAGTKYAVAPSVSSRVHHQRDRRRGRATKKVGAFYSFDSLDAGQSFRGIVQISGEDDETIEATYNSIAQALSTPLRLGKARRGTYGGQGSLTWDGAPTERETKLAQRKTLADGDAFCALLTSPYIGRNIHTGQVDPASIRENLGIALNGKVTVGRVFSSVTSSGRFDRTWGMPFVQSAAAAAGTVVMLTAHGVTWDALIALEHEGLGESRIDGFGRFAFTEAPAEVIHIAAPVAEKTETLSGEPPDILVAMQRRLVRGRMVAAIERRAERLAGGATNIPSTSLLGRLRNSLRQSPAEALGTLYELVRDRSKEKESKHHEGLKEPALTQLRKCRLDGQQLLDFLCEYANPTSSKELDDAPLVAARTYLTNKEAATEEILSDRDKYTVHFLDTVLGTLMRKAKKARSA